MNIQKLFEAWSPKGCRHPTQGRLSQHRNESTWIQLTIERTHHTDNPMHGFMQNCLTLVPRSSNGFSLDLRELGVVVRVEGRILDTDRPSHGRRFTTAHR